MLFRLDRFPFSFLSDCLFAVFFFPSIYFFQISYSHLCGLLVMFSFLLLTSCFSLSATHFRFSGFHLSVFPLVCAAFTGTALYSLGDRLSLPPRPARGVL